MRHPTALPLPCTALPLLLQQMLQRLQEVSRPLSTRPLALLPRAALRLSQAMPLPPTAPASLTPQPIRLTGRVSPPIVAILPT